MRFVSRWASIARGFVWSRKRGLTLLLGRYSDRGPVAFVGAVSNPKEGDVSLHQVFWLGMPDGEYASYSGASAAEAARVLGSIIPQNIVETFS